MENIVFWIWLSICFSYGSGKPQQLAETFDAKDIYENKEEICKTVEYLTARDRKALLSTPIERAQAIYDRCRILNIRVISYNDDEYPEKLRHIYSAPIILYVQGDISYLNSSLNITVVGTRKASNYGKTVTGNLSYTLASSGVVIISGCAEGIDEFAHRGAVKAKARTVGVLGCGHDINYPVKNNRLKKEILVFGGALISELPPGTHVTKGYFPVRNRIMAGLADGVLVTEAPVRSGSLITARLANDMDRDVFCVTPYDIYNPDCIGVVSLLRDGAKAIFNAKDILEEYTVRYEGKIDWGNADKFTEPTSNEFELAVASESSYKVSKPKVSKIRPETPKNLSEKQRKVYEALEFEPIHVDDLTRKVDLACYEVLSVLTELELMDTITAHSGRRYSLKDE